MLAIAIVASVGILISILVHAGNGKLDVDTAISAVAVMAWWSISLPVSIVIMGLVAIILIIALASR